MTTTALHQPPDAAAPHIESERLEAVALIEGAIDLFEAEFGNEHRLRCALDVARDIAGGVLGPITEGAREHAMQWCDDILCEATARTLERVTNPQRLSAALCVLAATLASLAPELSLDDVQHHILSAELIDAKRRGAVH